MKHPRSVEDAPLVTVTDLGEPGPGADLVDHLGAVLERLGAATSVEAEVSEAIRGDLLDLFDAQAASRWLDVAARRMQATGDGRHTIASAGHEGNAAVALCLRSNDPALLHHRSRAFYLARTALAGLDDGILDIALGLAGAADQSATGGRSPGLTHPDVAILPQSPTVAGHLPRALGLAWTLGRQQRARGGERLKWPDDAVAVASFGDGSANHSTAAGAVNSACWAARQGVPMPLLLICEDNGLSASMPTPPGWIRSLYEAREGLRYLSADTAGDPLAVLETTHQAVEIARTHRRPVLLHLSCVRIGGHSGSDHEETYRRADRIAADLAKDPLVATMEAMVRTGVLGGQEVAERLLDIRDRVASAVEEALHRPKLATSADVMAPMAPRRPAAVAILAARVPPPSRRAEAFGELPPELEGPLTLSESINRALLDAALVSPNLVLLGRDIGRLGGAYGVTRGLHKRLGPTRVVDTVLDEQTTLGLSLGAAVSGLLPVAEIQNLTDLYAAGGQLRNEAATLSFLSGGAYRNPLVIRVPGLPYQDGIGGAAGGDNAFAMLRDIPGLVIACPAHPSEAPGLLRTCLAAAEADGTISVFLEPIALYDQRDMLKLGDDAWRAPYPAPPLWGSFHAPIGRASVWGAGSDLTIVSYGNGLRMSMRVAAELERDGIDCRVVDLRWLAPLPLEDVFRAANATGRLLIVDETRRTGGVSEGLVTGMLEAGFDGKLVRVTARDSVVPAGSAADLVLVTEKQIAATARALCKD
ncbi:MAG TPA: transketolase C-terminal domain-containing protein [Kineosporiaceae bacterium]|nr:transketolase C-terminal domain-containing protein [Kineosporiaceae bacterium]